MKSANKKVRCSKVLEEVWGARANINAAAFMIRSSGQLTSVRITFYIAPFQVRSATGSIDGMAE